MFVDTYFRGTPRVMNNADNTIDEIYIYTYTALYILYIQYQPD